MRVQIGRFGLDPIVDNAAAAKRGDGGLTISGTIRAATLAEFTTLRAQLNGLEGNDDEPVVPIIVEGASNEYWAVTGVSWDDGAGAYDGLFTADWSVDLVSIPARAGALLESRMLMVATSATPWTAVPVGAQGWASTKAGVTSADRASESGAVRVFSAAALADATATWRQRPADAYIGAATLRAGMSGFAADQMPDPGPGAFFASSAGNYNWTVPAGITRVRAVVVGANGGTSINGAAGGRGARVTCDLDVTPGEVLRVVVGGAGRQGAVPPVGTQLGGGAGGFNGGGRGGHVNQTAASFRAGGCGGGGASDIRQGGTGLANRVIVAAGGGGAATSADGGTAQSTNGGTGAPYPPNGGGGGGTSTAGGAGGGGGAAGGAAGTSGSGGQGGELLTSGTWAGGGGGGGGYFGGGGGFVQQLVDAMNSNVASSGGAGSSLTTGINATIGPSWETSARVMISPLSETGVGDPADGVAYATIVGRQVDVDPWGWMLSNGITRVRPTYSATEIGFAVQTWTGAAWGVVHRFGIYRWSGAAWSSATAVPVSVVVLRNAPEAVSLRVTYADSSATRSHTVDVTLRRGAAWADLTFTSNAGGTWGIAHDPAGTATAIGTSSNAVLGNTTDADGNKWLITGAKVASGDVVLTPPAGTKFASLPATVQAGVVLASETATTIAARARAVGSETVRAVGS